MAHLILNHARTPRRTSTRARTPLIQSLPRGLGILETVAARGAGITLAEVNRPIDLHASSAFHLLRTLVALGYLVPRDATRRYRLGPRVLRVVAAVGVSGPAWRLTPARVTRLAKAVVRSARRVSDRFGHRTAGVRSGTP